MSPLFILSLVLAGVGTGIYGSLVGLGGGFILVPLLLYLYPEESPRIITAVSLAVVFFNALSGSLAYARMRRIDYSTGLPYALATVPGALLGTVASRYVSREVFDPLFGLMLGAVSLFLLLRPQARLSLPRAKTKRVVVDGSGQVHAYRTNLGLGVGLSFLAGFVATSLGLGGGVFHIPILIGLLQFPVHIATATSHFVLSITAFTASLAHLIGGAYSGTWQIVLALGAGVIVGAQVGARLSERVAGPLLVRLLAVGLLLVGARLLWQGLTV
ncbi:MAG: sulfite exporter TauE/SafE family protein [Chloroflexi bacterium]|nr:sulfite exporter TauE/SafE family protein [Chloroflexota bacterium]